MSSGINGLPRAYTLPLLLVCAAVVTGCAAHYTPEAVRDPYGFWSGIWHGFVAPWAILANCISWTLGLFSISFMDSIQIIGRPNTGWGWYYIGFLIGLTAYGGGAR